MGRDIHIRIVKYNSEIDKWEEIKLFREEKANSYTPIRLSLDRNYELFEILDEDINFKAVNKTNLPKDLVDEIENWEKDGGFRFREINLAELEIYKLNHPKVRDWDYEEDHEKAWYDTPLNDLIIRILNMVELFNYCRWDYYTMSDIRIIYWFD